MAAPDFSAMLKKTSGTAKRPPALPPGSYRGKAKSWEIGDKNKNNTPYVRIHIALTDWPDNVDDSDKMQEGPDGALIPINLSKRSLRRDIFIRNTDGSDAMYRLDDFLKSCNIELGKAYEETLPQVIGADLLVDVTQYLNEKNGETENQVDRIVGVQ